MLLFGYQLQQLTKPHHYLIIIYIAQFAVDNRYIVQWYIMVYNNTHSPLPSLLISSLLFAIVSPTNISINYHVRNLHNAAVCAIMTLLAKHRTLCHALPTDRLICSAVTVRLWYGTTSSHRIAECSNCTGIDININKQTNVYIQQHF